MRFRHNPDLEEKLYEQMQDEIKGIEEYYDLYKTLESIRAPRHILKTVHQIAKDEARHHGILEEILKDLQRGRL